MKTLILTALLAAGTALPQIAAAQGDFRVTLLGTGSPRPLPDRFSMSTLVEAGDQKLVFDAGRGATIRIYEKGIPLEDDLRDHRRRRHATRELRRHRAEWEETMDASRNARAGTRRESGVRSPC